MTNDDTLVPGAPGATTPRASRPEPFASLHAMPWSTDVLHGLLRGDANVAWAMAGAAYSPYLVDHPWLLTIRVNVAVRGTQR